MFSEHEHLPSCWQALFLAIAWKTDKSQCLPLMTVQALPIIVTLLIGASGESKPNSMAAANADGHQKGEPQNGKGSTALTASAASQANGHAASCALRNGKTPGAGATCVSTLASSQNGHHHVQGGNAKGGALAEATDVQGPAQLQLFDLVYSLVRISCLARLIHQHLSRCALALYSGFQ